MRRNKPAWIIIGAAILILALVIVLTPGPRGEQTTMVMGEGRSPTVDHLRRLGETAALKKPLVNEIIDQTREAVRDWPSLAEAHGVTKTNIKLVGDRLARFK